MSYDRAERRGNRAPNGHFLPGHNIGLATRWNEGQSGNPDGRPAKSLMQKAREEIANDPDFVSQWKEATKKRMLTASMVGFFEGRENQERVDGKVADVMEVAVNMTLSQRLEKAKERLALVERTGTDS